VLLGGSVFAAAAPNPRGSAQVSDVQRENSPANNSVRTENTATNRSATRGATQRNARSAIAPASGIVVGRAARLNQSTASGGATLSQGRLGGLGQTATTAMSRIAITTAARSATPAGSARSAISGLGGGANMSRAGTARATAVFSDLSKMGTGYQNCRESYNTCMDQFCANANDTWRRCYCSDKFTEFQDTEAALDQAKTLLMQFQDNNLNAVDKSAAEVNAMYQATVGEAAIKKDVSASQKIMTEIADLISGKKKADKTVTLVQVDFSAAMEDIWDGGDGGIFGGGSNDNLTEKSGKELYNAVNKQCTEMVKESCDNNATFTMAKSAYSILIGNDCNSYEKKITQQREAVAKTVREAEQILRDARLEEYRSHNSADVNECITKVKTAIVGPMACGEDYAKCLDYTGMYINATTGEPIYSAHLQDLTKLIKLDGLENGGSIAQMNPQFNKFMDGKRMFAESALNTCRDKADIVWNEFKRQSMVEIAQAQDEKIEEVKSTCVSTMKECYDTQSGALASFDNTRAQSTGALNAYAAKAMCADKVAACAAVYAGPNDPKCTFDQATGKVTNAASCGLAALQSFVSAVDNVKVAEGCKDALDNYVKDLCRPLTSDGKAYPYGCRNLQPGLVADNGLTDQVSDNSPNGSLAKMLAQFAITNCGDPSNKPTTFAALKQQAPEVARQVQYIVEDAVANMAFQLRGVCEECGGLYTSDANDIDNTMEPDIQYASQVYGGTNVMLRSMSGISISGEKLAKAGGTGTNVGWGICINSTEQLKCRMEDENTGGKGFAKYDSSTNSCKLEDGWYQYKCEQVVKGRWTEIGTCLYKGG
jgi:hypothetical protein